MKCGVFSRPKQKQKISGDAYTFQQWDDFVLISLVDGLGSGEQAAKASRLAVDCIEKKRSLPLVEILRECHLALRNSRGAVMGLLRLNLAKRKVRYVGVGNIGVYVVAQVRFHPISYNGIVGYRLPRVHEFVSVYHPGDTFVLYSDGVESRFHSDAHMLTWEGDPQHIAEFIAQRYGKDNDDVSVVVAR